MEQTTKYAHMKQMHTPGMGTAYSWGRGTHMGRVASRVQLRATGLKTRSLVFSEGAA